MAKTVAELEKELEEARIAERDKKAAEAEYPKMVPLPGDPENRLVVHSKEEESAHKGEVVKAFDLTPEEQDAKTFAKAEADKEAAKGKSRLAGSSSKADERAAKATSKKDGKKEAKAKKAAKAEKPGIVARAKAKLGRK